MNAQSVGRNFCDNPHISKVNISSVHGLVLTKAEVLDLLNVLSLENTTVFRNLNENALFVVPISYIVKNLKNTVAGNALKLPTAKICVEKEIPLTLMDEVRIKSAIEAITGTRSENNVTLEMDTNADTAGSIVEERKYKHISLSHIKKEEVTNYLISLLYVLFVIPELNKSRNSSLKEIQNRDLIYRFHKNWAIEALRVLKPGAFAFVMSSPRSDLLPLMTTALRDVGFNIGFSSIYWTYSTGFPKAQNVSKVIDKRAGVKQKVVGEYQHPDGKKRNSEKHKPHKEVCNPETSYGYKSSGFRELTSATTPQAKALDGAYGGFQPKPAVEVIIVAMKPIEEKTYMDQALKNGHGCTWLDDARIPYLSNTDATKEDRPNCVGNHYSKSCFQAGYAMKLHNNKGRFPANVLCEDDVLNDGNIRKSGDGIKNSIRNDYSSNTFQIN